MPTIKHLCVLFFSAIFFVGFSFSTQVSAFTVVDADVVQDTVWTKENSPYVIGNSITVSSGATLVIEPGAIVKFNPYFGVSVKVSGKIIADGTGTEPIYFTSNYDDEIGGNTDDEEYCYENTDEEGNVIDEICESFDPGDPLAGDWGEFYLKDSTGSSFKNVFFEYARGTLTIESSDANFENLNIDNSVIGLNIYENSHVEINVGVFNNLDRDNLVLYNGSSLIFSDLTFMNVYTSIAIFNDSSFVGNNLKIENVSPDIFEAIVLFNNSTFSIKDSFFKNCPRDSCITFFDGNDPAYLADPSSVDIENTIFDGGLGSGMLAFGDTNISVNVKNSSFNNFSLFAIENYSSFTINAENNFWGDESGPYHEILNPEGFGNSFYGDVSFKPFCKKESCISRNPVIIVPGLLGTEILKPAGDGGDEPEKLWLDLARNLSDIGDQFMDALQFNWDLTPSDTSLIVGDVIGRVTFFNYSEDLIEEFKNQGYIENEDLFLFPYDWRYGVSEDTVTKLKQKITDVLVQTESEEVDIVAHSMGGLLVKKYVAENPENNNINKTVFVGVPNTGAPKAVKALIQGDGNLLTSDKEMKKISQNMPAAYDLLPSEKYFNIKGSYVEVVEQKGFSYEHRDLTYEDMNDFLTADHKLNAQALLNAQKLHTKDFDNYDLRTAGVDLYAIDGCKTGTFGKMIEVRYRSLFGDSIAYATPKEVPGDGTVPLESATNLPIDEINKFYALESDHKQMLTQNGIRQQIVNIISGSDLSTKSSKDKDIITQDIAKCKLNGKAISVFSPLSIDVIDQDGNHLGLVSNGVSIENNIPNADFNIIDDHKFVYLPTDEGQIYTITVAGTGTGTFTITGATIEESNVTRTQVFSDISVTPSLLGSISISNDTNTILSLDTDGNGTTDQTLEPTSTLDAVASQDFIPELPENNLSPDNTESNTHMTSGSRGNRVAQVSQDNTTTQNSSNLQSNVVAEVSTKAPVVKQKNTTNLELSTKNIEQISTEGNLVQDNTLTANVADSDAPIDYGAIQIVLAGCVIVLLIARKYVKV